MFQIKSIPLAKKSAMKIPHFASLICLSILSTLNILSCKSRVGNQSESEVKGFEIESDMPLPVMYHIGEKSVLLKNHGRSKFTDDEWINITKAHAHYRKGLYVGQHPAYSEHYANKYMSQENKGVPWLMTVKIKPECLVPNRVAPYLTDLHKDRQFVNWYKEIAKEEHENLRGSFLTPNIAGQHLTIFTSKCLINQSTNNVHSPSNDKKELEDLWKPFDNEKVESACANTFNAYINQPDLNNPKSTISIVRDTYWPNRGFWYIRDQSCIEQMESDAESTIKIFADSSDLWDEQPFASGLITFSGDGPGEERLVLLSIFLNAASEIPIEKFPQYYPAIMDHASETGAGRTIRAPIAAGSEANIFPRNVFFAAAEAFMRCSQYKENKVEYGYLKTLSKDLAKYLEQNGDLYIYEVQKNFLDFHTKIDRLCGGQENSNLRVGKLLQDSTKTLFTISKIPTEIPGNITLESSPENLRGKTAPCDFLEKDSLIVKCKIDSKVSLIFFPTGQGNAIWDLSNKKKAIIFLQLFPSIQ